MDEMAGTIDGLLLLLNESSNKFAQYLGVLALAQLTRSPQLCKVALERGVRAS